MNKHAGIFNSIKNFGRQAGRQAAGYVQDLFQQPTKTKPRPRPITGGSPQMDEWMRRLDAIPFGDQQAMDRRRDEYAARNGLPLTSELRRLHRSGPGTGLWTGTNGVWRNRGLQSGQYLEQLLNKLGLDRRSSAVRWGPTPSLDRIINRGNQMGGWGSDPRTIQEGIEGLRGIVDQAGLGPLINPIINQMGGWGGMQSSMEKYLNGGGQGSRVGQAGQAGQGVWNLGSRKNPPFGGQRPGPVAGGGVQAPRTVFGGRPRPATAPAPQQAPARPAPVPQIDPVARDRVLQEAGGVEGIRSLVDQAGGIEAVKQILTTGKSDNWMVNYGIQQMGGVDALRQKLDALGGISGVEQMLR